MMIEIANDGPRITNTNYWETPHAKRGLVYLSINARAYRLLTPPAMEPMLAEIFNAREVVISRGPWPQYNKPDALEIMFEDGSDSPYAVHLLTDQIDRLPQPHDQGWKGTLAIYTATSYVPAWTCDMVYYRTVKQIPWLRPAPVND